MNPEQNKAPMTCNGCGCKCHKCGPLMIVLIGLVWLAGSLSWLSAGVVSIVLPILVFLLGVGKMCKCCKK